jgi:hypothetical protein
MTLSSSSTTTPEEAPSLAGTGKNMPNQYIVALKNTPTVPSGVVEAKNTGASILDSYDRVLNGFAKRMPKEIVLEAIQRNPNVAYVEQDMRVQEFSQTLPTGVNRVDSALSSTISATVGSTVNAILI